MPDSSAERSEDEVSETPDGAQQKRDKTDSDNDAEGSSILEPATGAIRPIQIHDQSVSVLLPPGRAITSDSI